MRKAMLGAVIGGALAILLLPSASRASSGAVVAADHAFVPPVVIMQAGEEISFTNLDLSQHSVTSTAWDHATGAALFNSGLVATGHTAAVTGTAALGPGSYTFFCTMHPDMQGTLIVV